MARRQMRYVIPVPFHMALAQRMIGQPTTYAHPFDFLALIACSEPLSIVPTRVESNARLHKPKHRVEDTISEALTRLKHKAPCISRSRMARQNKLNTSKGQVE